MSSVVLFNVKTVSSVNSENETGNYKDLVEELTKLQNRDQENARANTSAEEFIDCDEQVLARAALPTEDEIIAELIGEDVVEVEDSQEESQEDSQESNDNSLTKPTTDEIRDAIESSR
eukprot:gene8310-biopygen9398